MLPERTLPPLVATRLHRNPLLFERSALEAILGAAPQSVTSVQPVAQIERDKSLRAFGYYTAEGCAVVPVFGTLMKRGTGIDWLDEWLGVTSCERLQASIQQALVDPMVESILLQIDSPGGECSGIFDVADFVYAARGTKPLWAIADEFAYSAGYLLASAAERVILPRTGGVGSIGVYTVRVDVTGLDEQMGVRWDIIEYGARKADGNPHKPVSDAERADLQAEVDRIGEMFVAAVSRNRGLGAKAIRDTEARIFKGENAVSMKLADSIGTFSDAVLELATEPRSARRGTQGGRMEKGTGEQQPQAAEPLKGVVTTEQAAADRDAAVKTAATAARGEGEQLAEARMKGLMTVCREAVRIGILEPDQESAVLAGLVEKKVSPDAAREELMRAAAERADAAAIRSEHRPGAKTTERTATIDPAFALAAYAKRAAVVQSLSRVGR